MVFSCHTRSSYSITREVSRKGVGLFSGQEARLTLRPLPPRSGVVIVRKDIVGPALSLGLSRVQGTPRCTVIGHDAFSVQTVEHLMAALHAYAIDDIGIELSGPEVPIFDGSSLPFLDMLEEAGLREQGEKQIHCLQEPVYWSQGDVHIVALPSEELRISYTLHYTGLRCLETQFFSVSLNADTFKKEIAPCRTFAMYEEVIAMIEKGLLKGGSLDTAVVIREGQVVNPEGLRLPAEMARHKILDMVGDLYLMGMPFYAHIIGIRSGHYANTLFAGELMKQMQKEMV